MHEQTNENSMYFSCMKMVKPAVTARKISIECASVCSAHPITVVEIAIETKSEYTTKSSFLTRSEIINEIDIIMHETISTIRPISVPNLKYPYTT
jgi:hypothetical protein